MHTAADVSVVIPAYNAAAYVSRALESIRKQTIAHWEIVFVDDASTDDTPGIVEDFARTVGNNVAILRNEENRGVAASRNRGVRHAEGRVVAFLDADDYWDDDHLACGIDCLASGADICCSGIRLFDETEGNFAGEVTPTEANSDSPVEKLFERSFIQTSSSVMFLRAAAESVGDFREDLEVGEDWDYWMRFLLGGFRLRYTGRRTCNYRKHSESTMANTLKVSRDMVKFYERYADSSEIPRRLRRKRFADSLSDYGRLTMRSDPEVAMEMFRRAWSVAPGRVALPAYLCFAAFRKMLKGMGDR